MILLDELAEVAFVRGLAPEHVRQLALLARSQECLAGTVLFREGQESASVYLVLRGNVSLEIEVSGRGPVPVQTVTAGELLGWSPVLRLGPMTATARALTRCRLAVLDAARVVALTEQDPRFGVEFLRRTAATMAQRLSAARRAGAFPETMIPK